MDKEGDGIIGRRGEGRKKRERKLQEKEEATRENERYRKRNGTEE